jgi:hypothetical protein
MARLEPTAYLGIKSRQSFIVDREYWKLVTVIAIVRTILGITRAVPVEIRRAAIAEV